MTSSRWLYRMIGSWAWRSPFWTVTGHGVFILFEKGGSYDASVRHIFLVPKGTHVILKRVYQNMLVFSHSFEYLIPLSHSTLTFLALCSSVWLDLLDDRSYHKRKQWVKAIKKNGPGPKPRFDNVSFSRWKSAGWELLLIIVLTFVCMVFNNEIIYHSTLGGLFLIFCVIFIKAVINNNFLYTLVVPKWLDLPITAISFFFFLPENPAKKTDVIVILLK